MGYIDKEGEVWTDSNGTTAVVSQQGVKNQYVYKISVIDNVKLDEVQTLRADYEDWRDTVEKAISFAEGYIQARAKYSNYEEEN